jgi:hypothetical protein
MRTDCCKTSQRLKDSFSRLKGLRQEIKLKIDVAENVFLPSFSFLIYSIRCVLIKEE